MNNFQIRAASVQVDLSDLEIDGHPNAAPFSGTLLQLDRPSDQPPQGSQGHRILVPSDVAAKKLGTLVGMGLNYAASLEEHAPRNKVGVITEAWIDGSAVKVKGIIWKKDRPDAMRAMHGTEDLGMSMELADVSIRDPQEDVWHIVDLNFTGATVLFQDAAAYHKTALAASAEVKDEVNKISRSALAAARAVLGKKEGTRMSDKIKREAKKPTPDQGQLLASAIAAAVGPAVSAAVAESMKTIVGDIKASQDELAKNIVNTLAASAEESEEDQAADQLLASADVKNIKADADDDSGDDEDDDDADDVDAAAYDDDDDDDDDDMDAAIGNLNPGEPDGDDDDPGHANKSGGKSKGHKTTREPEVVASKSVKAKANGKTVKAMKAANAVIAELRASNSKLAQTNQKLQKQNGKLSNRIDAMEAQVERFSSQVERRTVTPELSMLLQKSGYNVSELMGSNRKLTVEEFNGILESSPVPLDPKIRIAMKMQAEEKGLMENGVVSRY